jgi:hypothetical protein
MVKRDHRKYPPFPFFRDLNSHFSRTPDCNKADLAERRELELARDEIIKRQRRLQKERDNMEDEFKGGVRATETARVVTDALWHRDASPTLDIE